MHSKAKSSTHLLHLNIIKILFYIFPISFIVGNFAVSLNILMFIILSSILIYKQKLPFRIDSSCWLLIIFFSYFFLSTAIQYLTPGILNEKMEQFFPFKYDPILKSFLLVRFLILIFLVDILFFNKILNLKKLLLSSLICTSFVSIDIIVQFFAGIDLFGHESFQQWNSGPFGDEKIAGGYLKNFSFFSFFYIFFNIKKTKRNNFFFILIITTHLCATLMSGNRMSLILLLFGLFLIFLIIKNLRLITTLSVVFFLGLSLFLLSNDSFLKYTYKTFLGEIDIRKFSKSNQEIGSSSEDEIQRSRATALLRHSGYNRVFRSSIIMWKEKPLIGSGLKSFRIKCWEILENDNEKYSEYGLGDLPQSVSCGQHQHHYYLQILGEAGIIGLLLIGIFFLIFLKDSLFFLKKIYKENNTNFILMAPIIINIFLEIWPLRSAGSFFTTWNASFFWLNVAIFISLKSLFKAKNENF